MSSSPKLDVGERRALQDAGRPVRSVFVAVIVFYSCASVLNGTYIHEDAKLREFGGVRTVWMAATRPLANMSEFLKVHLLRDQVEKLRNEKE